MGVRVQRQGLFCVTVLEPRGLRGVGCGVIAASTIYDCDLSIATFRSSACGVVCVCACFGSCLIHLTLHVFLLMVIE